MTITSADAAGHVESDIGYNFAVDQAGRVWDLRGLVRVGAHCASPSNPDANHEYIGVLLILGDSEQPSAAMIEAVRDFRTRVFLKRWPGRTQTLAHGDVPGASTACPGTRARNLVRANEFERAPGPAPAPPAPTPPVEREDEEMIGIVSRYGSSQYVLIGPGPRVQRLSAGTYNGLAKTPGIKTELLTNGQINALISLQGYRERRDRAVLWTETTVRRGSNQVSVLQEVADILTLVKALPALIKDETDLSGEQLARLAEDVSSRVDKVHVEITEGEPKLEDVVPGLVAEPDEPEDQ